MMMSSKTTTPLLLLVAIISTALAGDISPKMVAEEVTPGKPLATPLSASEVQSETISSNNAVYLGDCAPGTPYKFPIANVASSGRGAISTSSAATITLGWETPIVNNVVSHSIEVTGDSEPNFFGVEGSNDGDMIGWPFEYKYDHPNPSATAVVTCDSDTPIVVVVHDGSNTSIEAQVEEVSNGQQVTLLNGVAASGPLSGETRGHKGGPSPIALENANPNSALIRHDSKNKDVGIAIIQATLEHEGKTLNRSFIVNSKAPKGNKQGRTMNVKCCDITDDGDITLSIPGLSKPDEYYRVSVRMGLSIDGSSDEPIDVVDVTAFLDSNEGEMTVHGGWLRLALEDAGLSSTDDGWDVVVKDMVVEDPEDGYSVVGKFGKQIGRKLGDQSSENGIPESQRHKKRLLSQSPSHGERSISKEMLQGKVPQRELERRERRRNRRLQLEEETNNLRGGARQLQYNGKKILVHGYCAESNPFPTSHFTNEIAFSDPGPVRRQRDRALGGGGGANNWSHDEFARKIGVFANINGIDGCGIIAHSQGGAASVHLYSYYWSCLDYAATSGRKIQSVGTPYQGTALAGTIAALGDIFGAGCGTNTDLTYSGASSWLPGIPNWARSAVNYYTTSFEDKWWRYDYCHLASDVLLSDPDDGTTEQWSGQLSGAYNRGHKDNQCHTTGMRDPAQYLDSSRNSEMNSYAQY